MNLVEYYPPSSFGYRTFRKPRKIAAPHSIPADERHFIAYAVYEELMYSRSSWLYMPWESNCEENILVP